MRMNRFVFAFASVAAVGLMAAPAVAQQSSSQQRVVATNRDHTVFVTRDEDGRKRTKIIVQKRSYLDPGTEPLPGERNTLDYIQAPGQRATAPLNNTIADSDRGRMFNPFDLPSLYNPWIP